MMKKISFIIILGLVLISCSKRGSGDICISADLTTVSVAQDVTVVNCGDLPPESYVESTIDWGDGTITSGLSGSHSYQNTGIYDIQALMNGDWAGDVTDAEDSKVKITITVQ